MNKLLILAAVATLAACAQTPTAEAPLANSLTSVSKIDPQCLQTGTRIRLEAGDCAAVSGRVFSKEELDQTGAFTLSEALQKLDPSLGR